MTILLWKSAIDDYMDEHNNSDETWMSFHKFEVVEDCGDRKRTVKGPFSFFLPQFHNGEHNSYHPNHNPQRHNTPELGMFGLVSEYLYPQP